MKLKEATEVKVISGDPVKKDVVRIKYLKSGKIYDFTFVDGYKAKDFEIALRKNKGLGHNTVKNFKKYIIREKIVKEEDKSSEEERVKVLNMIKKWKDEHSVK
ncbi:MAG TPA: hypothetical protein VMZ91_13065 [Candidatus Paceibacterota bacterium]|nr:hypothetical protein [Candidatus Paceibacterota bacterium]